MKIRIPSLVLIVLSLLSLCFVNTSAAASDFYRERLAEYIDIEAFDALYDSTIGAGANEMDLTSLHIFDDEDNNIERLIESYIEFSIPKYYYVRYVDLDKDNNNYFTKATVIRTLDEEKKMQYDAYNVVADELTKDLVNNPNLSDFEKALILNERLIDICEYNYDDIDNPINQTPYSALVLGKSVCGGYTQAYHVLLDKVEIKDERIRMDKRSVLVLVGKPY